MTDAQALRALAVLGVSVGDLVEALADTPAAASTRIEAIQRAAKKRYRAHARGAHPDAGGATDASATEEFRHVTTVARAVTALRRVDPGPITSPTEDVVAMTISILRGAR